MEMKKTARGRSFANSVATATDVKVRRREGDGLEDVPDLPSGSGRGGELLGGQVRVVAAPGCARCHRRTIESLY